MEFLPTGHLRTLADDGRHKEGANEKNTSTDSFGRGSSACLISNDPQANDFPELPICNVDSYLCATKNIFAFDITYQYEVHYNPLNPEPRILRFIDETVLEHLATKIGVVGCVGTSDGVGPGGGRSRGRWLGGFSEEQKDRVKGISLFPEDKPNGSSCTQPLEGDTADDSVCVPVSGSMKISTQLTQEEVDAYGELSSEEKEGLRASVLDAVKTGMDEDLFLFPGNIYKVNFIEQETNSTDNGNGPTDDGNDPGTNVGGSKSPEDPKTAGDAGSPPVSPLVAALVSVAIFLLILLLVILFCLRRRRQNRKSNEGTLNKTAEGSSEDEEDPEGGLPGGSLANRDSLALKPQFLPSDDEAPNVEDGESMIVRGPLTPQRALGVESSYHDEEETEDYEDEYERRSRTDFSRSLTSFDVAMYELDAIAEASSQEQSLGMSAQQESFDSAQISRGRTQPETYPESTHGLYFADTIDDQDVYYDSSSESTPRRVLQMS